MVSASKEQSAALERLLEDLDLERLEEIAQQFNIFDVLGIQRQESAHSNFLAWLLSPSGSHGLSDYFLKRFLWKTASLAQVRRNGEVTPLYIDSLNLGDVDVRREWRKHGPARDRRYAAFPVRHRE